MKTKRGSMKTKLVRIGNSRGVRIPKPLLQQAGLEDEIRLRLVKGGIVIEAEKPHRAGWAEAAAKAHEKSDDGLLDGSVPTQFDEAEWEWTGVRPPGGATSSSSLWNRPWVPRFARPDPASLSRLMS